jgi:DNA-binding MarR family transcriptional regulator
MDVTLDGWRLFFIVVGTMIVMGLFGGAVNFLLATKDDPENTKLKSVGAGLAASLLVPLFLKIIGSDLLKTKAITLTDLLVFAGFCLIAAISSKAFMKTLAERVLQKAEEANKTAQATKNEVKEQAERVEELVTEPERQTPETATAKSQKLATPPAPALDPNSIKVLQALLDSRFVMRTLSGIAMDVGLTISEVVSVLSTLEKNGLAQVVQRPKGERAAITAQGRAALINAKLKSDMATGE